jgi:hypothetical protein
MPHYTDWVTTIKANVRPQNQPESLIVPTDGDDILVVKPEANDILTGLDVGPVNKLADNGWWTVDGANFRATQEDSLIEGDHSSDIWTNGGASTYCTGYCLMDSSNPDGLTIMTETFEPVPGMDSFGESMNPFLEERSNWSELCDVGLSVRRAEMMPSFAIA